ncbi:hypothetical protein SAMN04488066_101151 [Halorubrum aquaticum]|uniref:DUF7344 domain-containing protein n=1 Tax=Halorubrum aquaticum TaxID=387340 RepID=A0A1I2Z218_9EURY|nr:hypothetical protein [Halorubrum aquaticum]SFH31937.1 hypothetical protein SAMN04488066_101151 [Halorubrum aquaticum]
MGGSTELTASNEAASPSDAGSTDSEGPTRDEIFDVLCNERRRYVLEYLRESSEESLHLSEMVDTIAAWENDKDVVEIEYADRKRVYTALRQTHLPKLHETGVIEYDSRRGELRPTDGMEDVQLYLDYVPEHEIPWGQYYLGLSLIAALLFLGSAFVETVYGAVSLSTVAVVVAAFLVSSSVHTYRTRRNDVHRTPRKT